jgi:hypothetical protein
MENPQSGLLKDRYPEVYSLIDKDSNLYLDYENLFWYSNKELDFICNKAKCHHHKWREPISNLINTRARCPYCIGRKICECDSIFHISNVMRYWDFEENEKAGNDPRKIGKGSHKYVHAKCDKGKCGHHKWEVMVLNLVKGKGCPYCRHLKVCVCECLAILRPDLMKIWDFKKNKKRGLDPYKISLASGLFAWWKCETSTCGHHVWEAEIYRMTNPERSKCPFCFSVKRWCRCESFPILYPRLLEEFDQEKNKGIDPYTISKASNRFIWWLCNKGHSWQAQVHSRTVRGNGCFNCRQSKMEKKLHEILDNLKNKYNISYKPQQSYKECKNILPLPFDCGVNGFKKNALIETDGEHHFMEVRFGGDNSSSLADIQKRDNIKSNFCKNTGKHLLRISYSEKKNMEQYIIKFFEQILMSGQDGNQTVILFIGKEFNQ